jgi:hypothetical protein
MGPKGQPKMLRGDATTYRLSAVGYGIGQLGATTKTEKSCRFPRPLRRCVLSPQEFCVVMEASVTHLKRLWARLHGRVWDCPMSGPRPCFISALLPSPHPGADAASFRVT